MSFFYQPRYQNKTIVKTLTEFFIFLFFAIKTAFCKFLKLLISMETEHTRCIIQMRNHLYVLLYNFFYNIINISIRSNRVSDQSSSRCRILVVKTELSDLLATVILVPFGLSTLNHWFHCKLNNCMYSAPMYYKENSSINYTENSSSHWLMLKGVALSSFVIIFFECLHNKFEGTDNFIILLLNVKFKLGTVLFYKKSFTN